MSVQSRLDLLSEYETIKSPLMTFGKGSSLKMIVDLGNKDQSGNKKRAYEEFRFKSNKYNNYDFLVSGIIKFNQFLSLEYPNPDRNSNLNTKTIQIRDYSIDGVLKNMIDFDNNIMQAFKIGKNGDLFLISDRVIKVVSYPSSNSSIEFSQDIYEDENGKDIGVRLGFNEEFWVTVRMSTTWKKFLYIIRKCDLFGWGLQMIQVYLNMLSGTAVTELGTGDYNSTSRYSQYWQEDPDDIANSENSVNIKQTTKYLTNEEKKNRFFDS